MKGPRDLKRWRAVVRPSSSFEWDCLRVMRLQFNCKKTKKRRRVRVCDLDPVENR